MPPVFHQKVCFSRPEKESRILCINMNSPKTIERYGRAYDALVAICHIVAREIEIELAQRYGAIFF